VRRYGDYTGVDQTCPYIDSVRDFIESVEWSDEEKDLEAEAKKACEVLEKIRKMNSTLRDFGNKQAQELEEMEKDRDYYKKEYESQERDIKSLQEEVRDLEKQLSEVEN
jgi:polyhydroxyalkanoate synthesis regulator phasin